MIEGLANGGTLALLWYFGMKFYKMFENHLGRVEGIITENNRILGANLELLRALEAQNGKQPSSSVRR